MRAIGGFFELETGLTGRGEYHCDALRVCSARGVSGLQMRLKYHI